MAVDEHEPTLRRLLDEYSNASAEAGREDTDADWERVATLRAEIESEVARLLAAGRTEEREHHDEQARLDEETDGR